LRYERVEQQRGTENVYEVFLSYSFYENLWIIELQRVDNELGAMYVGRRRFLDMPTDALAIRFGRSG
jgi:hypothetical protein